MTDPVARFGLRRLINATGTVTRLGASLLHADVVAAMADTAGMSVDLGSLQGLASDAIAGCTGAQAGIVTSGATAALLVGAAACMAGLDPAKMARLPDTRGMRDEFIVSRGHRNSYDHGVRAAGARLVEVGLPDRSTRCGVRDAETWEFAAAVGERTAGILYLAGADARPDLPAVVRVAHAAGLPVLVDAAAELPPAANLRRFIDEGADLVAFSGGKAIGGPSASGILCGRRELVGSALLQQLDLDCTYEDWQPPPQLIDKRELQGVPRHGIGRACKVGKEQIVALLTALMRFVDEGDDARNARYARLSRSLAAELGRLTVLRVRVVEDDRHGGLPMVEVCVAAPAPGALSAARLAASLRNATPAVHVDATDADRGVLLLAPTCLSEADVAPIVAAFRMAV